MSDEADAEETHSKHSHRSHAQIRQLVKKKLDAQGGSWSDAEVRNAGNIQIDEDEISITILVPLPYFHHTTAEPDRIANDVATHFPPTCQVNVEVLPPEER